MKTQQVYPQISEKSLNQTNKNRYTFKVPSDGNKTEIRKLIEKMYQVNVLKINIINQMGKKKRVRINRSAISRFGKRSDFKKAIITIKKGQKIKDFEIETEKNTPQKLETKTLKSNDKKI
ncbi:MAG: 50S ribosomal protein L23 [Candidatus Berkelbacteria bacterium Licking1014_7]|uniref:Large ribosomal subunit protein uL23 n=1 Tax=Candidatus Berkelbacteria bacterium Licking1014_7 TaxID=2017147 RepID=A0A554LKI6_9BACT|nr:MAG: 50S ribosomal protein L23 [Candidatus Berkelbacteria bacterium Licking1014_7]